MELTAQGTEVKEGTRTKVEPEGRRSPLKPKGGLRHSQRPGGKREPCRDDEEMRKHGAMVELIVQRPEV